jgi:DNA invertase Pin-like site-specific DNA recombinase
MKPAGRGIGYVRVSSDRQDTQRQYDNIQLWLRKHDLPDITILEDAGRRHQPEKRERFLQLTGMIQAKAIDWIVVDSLDRYGFGHPHEWGSFAWTMTKNGVTLWSATEDRPLNGDSIADLIISDVAAIGSRTEMVLKAQRDLGRKRSMAEEGLYTGGWVPFGTDVACQDQAGKPRWRVVTVGKWQRIRIYPDGRQERWDGRNNFPGDRMVGDRLMLVPTVKTERITILNDVFTWFVNETLSFDAIARRLNERGTYHPFGPWYGLLVRNVLRNPTVIGLPAYNRRANSLYAELLGGRINTDPPRRGPTRPLMARQRERSEWIVPPKPVFEPLVPVALFEAAQTKLGSLKRHAKAPRSSTLWLAGLVYCAKCGCRMIGWYYPKDRKDPNSYCCSLYRKLGFHNPSGCRHHRCSQSQIERLLDRYLEMIGKDIEIAGDLGLDGLLASTGEVRERLTGIITEMETYLIAHLDEVSHSEPLPDGRKRYQVGHLTLELPRCGDRETLRLVFDWLSGCRTGQLRERKDGLTKRLEDLYLKWDRMEGVAREWCEREMREVQTELSALQPVDLAQQYREALAELSKMALVINKTRREVPSRRKGQLVRSMIERIECMFEYQQCGQQTRSRLVSARFVPLIQAPEATLRLPTPPGRSR